jgi:hypothetical protein
LDWQNEESDVSPRRRRGRGGKKIDKLCELCVSVVNRNSDIITAESAERRVLIEKFSDLCELGVSVVKSSPETARWFRITTFGF